MITTNAPRLRLRALAFAVAAAALLPCTMASAQTISTVAGNGNGGLTGDGGLATAAAVGGPEHVQPIPGGGYYISGTAQIRKVDAAGVITTIAGTGTAGFAGDGGPATLALLSAQVSSVRPGPGNSLILADINSARIRKISATGIITTIAGNGSGGAVDGGQATASGLNTPTDAIADAAGNVYITEFGGCRVRKVDTSGVISTIAGNGSCTTSGDGGPASAATLSNPWGLAIGPNGDLHVAEYDGNRIRRIDAAGTISTVAGSIGIGNPLHISFDSAGNLYAAGFIDARVYKVTPAGTTSVIAGTGTSGFAGDGGPALSAQFSNPRAAVVDFGRLLIADSSNNRVRSFAADVAPVGIGAPLTCTTSGFKGPKLTLCRQICETTQPSINLTNKIRLYTAIYRETPPCGL